ncbi:hypothetical protein A3L04_06770 [Thermococcus chitonophagus]|uniref:Uncharacterized protein n=1 Tax=Thermococcus chitonophagus TaxID=54262 RepID=A0A160VWG1_9EURY|nr:hypothetical protein [Thermococcus chitonophagus]ASJ16799.1 hypothetical protein A3L04_06770 [Thermococcus chitonophagus]CUX78271.1 hypothetical protein CHITON_1492 [Thermococcus chitonophagus]
MRIIIKPDKGFGKIVLEIDEDLASRITEISRKFNISVEDVIVRALSGNFRQPRRNLGNLEKEVKELEKKVWELEKEYAPLRFKAYGVSEDNKLLAIELIGLMAENAQLRRFLRMKIERNEELRNIVRYYLSG